MKPRPTIASGWVGRTSQPGRASYDEASWWLDRCEGRRPGDPAVWQARLDWARSAGEPEAVRRALGRSSAGQLRQAEAWALRAWFAAQEGDRAAERKALDALLEREPGDTEALERLAGLAAEAGQTGRVVDLRRRKAELDRARESLQEAPDQGRPGPGWRTLAPGRCPGPGDRIAGLGDPGGGARPHVCHASGSRWPASSATGPQPLPPESCSPSCDRPSTRLGGGRRRVGAVRRLPAFVDDAAEAGLRFTFDNGQTPERQFPESGSGGVGLLDYDGDGWLDVYCVQGGPFPPPPGRAPNGDRLFRNRGDGSFEDATESSGIAALPGGYGHGVAVGDYDNDGHPDLFVTRWRSYALYRNRGDGTFEDTTQAAPVWAATATGRPRRRSPTWTATATWTSTSATTSSGTPITPRSAGTRRRASLLIATREA